MFHPSIIYNYSLTLFHLHDTGMFKSYPIKLIKTKIIYIYAEINNNNKL